MDWFKLIDIYGQSVTFNTDNTYTFRTNIGGILGLILGGTFILLFYIFGRGLFYHLDPKIVQQSVTLSEPQIFYVLKENLNYKFELFTWDSFGNVLLLPSNYFTVNAQVFFSPNTTIYDYFSVVQTDTSYSFVLNQDLKLYDFFLNRNYSCFSFYLDFCKNSSLCDLAEVSNYTQTNEIYLKMSYNRSTLDFSNVYNPQGNIEDYFMVGLSSNLFKNYFFTYKNVSVYTDLGWLLKTVNASTNLDIESSIEDVSYKYPTLTTTSLLSINVIFGRTSDSYYITYLKLQELLATVGGIINVLNLTFIALTSIYNRFEIDNYLVNCIYTYSRKHKDKSDEKSKDKEKSREKEKKRESLFVGNKENQETMKIENKSPTEPQSDVDLIKYKEKYEILKFTIWTLIKLTFCSCFVKKKEKFNIELFKKSLKLTYEKLDVKEYLRLFEQLHYLAKRVFKKDKKKLQKFYKRTQFFDFQHRYGKPILIDEKSDNDKSKSIIPETKIAEKDKKTPQLENKLMLTENLQKTPEIREKSPQYQTIQIQDSDRPLKSNYRFGKNHDNTKFFYNSYFK